METSLAVLHAAPFSLLSPRYSDAVMLDGKVKDSLLHLKKGRGKLLFEFLKKNYKERFNENLKIGKNLHGCAVMQLSRDCFFFFFFFFLTTFFLPLNRSD